MNLNRAAVPVPVANPGTVTISNASPAVVAKGAHGLVAGTPLIFTVAALATPVNAGFVQADTGGSLVASTTYFYRVSALNALGESLASTETSLATSAAAPATHTMTVNWGAVPLATGYKVYGRTTGAEQLIATVGAVTTYVDTGAITPAGALPLANTALGYLPYPLLESVEYYVGGTINAGDFQIAINPGGTAIATTSAGSGVITANVELFRIDCEDEERVGIIVKNMTANALTSFDVYVAMKQEHMFTDRNNTTQVGTIIDVRTNNLAADYTTPLYPLIKATASPVTLAGGGTVCLFFDVSAVAVLSVRALAGTATSLNIEGVMR